MLSRPAIRSRPSATDRVRKRSRRLVRLPSLTGSWITLKTIGNEVAALAAIAPGCTARRGEHGYSTVDQVGQQRRQMIVMALQPVVLDRHVLTFDVASPLVEAFASVLHPPLLTPER